MAGADAHGDALLARAILEGDQASFERLVRGVHGTLVRLARTIVGNQTTAEEVAQETWLAVVRGLPQFEGRSALKTWVISILVNRARTRAKQERRLVPFSAFNDGEQGGDDPGPERFSRRGFWVAFPEPWERASQETRVLDREMLRVLQDEIERLPPGQRAVVVLRDVEGLDAADVCNVLEITETNQRVLLHRARTRLRGALARYWADE